MLKKNQFVAISLHDIRSIGVTKGEKLFVDFRNGSIRVNRLDGGAENVVFRLTDSQEAQKEHSVHATHGEYAIVIPVAARIKQAQYQIRQDEYEQKVSAIAQVKECYLANCARRGQFEPDERFSTGMRMFTRFCQNRDTKDAEAAFDTFHKLCVGGNQEMHDER